MAGWEYSTEGELVAEQLEAKQSVCDNSEGVDNTCDERILYGSCDHGAVWKAQFFAQWDKHITITGPGTLMLTLDNDDVDPADIEAGLPRILDALNREWSK